MYSTFSVLTFTLGIGPTVLFRVYLETTAYNHSPFIVGPYVRNPQRRCRGLFTRVHQNYQC